MKNVLKNQSYNRPLILGKAEDYIHEDVWGYALGWALPSFVVIQWYKKNQWYTVHETYLSLPHIFFLFSLSMRIKKWVFFGFFFLSSAPVSLSCWKVPDWLCWRLKSFNYSPNRLCADKKTCKLPHATLLVHATKVLRPERESASLAKWKKSTRPDLYPVKINITSKSCQL